MIENEDRPAPADNVVPGGANDGSSDAKVGGAVDTPSTGMSGADFQRYIGRGLRAVYDDVAKQPVPDRFLELMKKLG